MHGEDCGQRRKIFSDKDVGLLRNSSYKQISYFTEQMSAGYRNMNGQGRLKEQTNK